MVVLPFTEPERIRPRKQLSGPHHPRQTMSNSSSVSSSRLPPGHALRLSRPESVFQDLLTSDGEFRLLQIEPAENGTAEINGQLFKASLDNPPPYEAVSYRWERTKEPHFIRVNGVEFLVMRNVYLMLSEFRRQSYPFSPIFWIDSVCINQSCISDRNNQVQLMGKIYSKSSLVRMWTGTESDFADQAFDLICRCGPADQKSEELVAAAVIENEAGTKALTKLLKRDYWNRMWVFQEIVLAREAVVHCGQLHAPWSTFRWLDAVSSKHVLWLPAQIERPWILELRRALFRIAHFCISPLEARHINNVVHPTRHLLCQDPRDKLYALRGVCEALKGIVKVDYSVPVRDVFKAFAQRQILQDGNLSTLLTAGIWNPLNGNDINLPSWVPDLRGMGGVDIRYLAGNHTSSFDANGSTFSLYNAFYPIKHNDFLEDDGSSILSIHATLFDCIEGHRPLQGILHSDTGRRELFKTFCFSIDDGTFSIWRLRQIFECLIFGDKRTLLQHPPAERHIHERARRLVLGYYQDLCQLFGPDPVFGKFFELFECCTSASEGCRPLKEEARLCNKNSLHLNHMEYLGRAAETTDRQETVLFITADGRLGVGPRSVQQDDVVVIVRGCRVPLALRRHATYYRLVGPVYMSGVMEGEYVRSHEQSGSLSFEPIQLV